MYLYSRAWVRRPLGANEAIERRHCARPPCWSERQYPGCCAYSGASVAKRRIVFLGLLRTAVLFPSEFRVGQPFSVSRRTGTSSFGYEESTA